MKCGRCSKPAENGILNPSNGKFVCQDCLAVLLRPMGAKPDEDVKVVFPKDGRVAVHVSVVPPPRIELP